jgi:hypothetical protein
MMEHMRGELTNTLKPNELMKVMLNNSVRTSKETRPVSMTTIDCLKLFR